MPTQPEMVVYAGCTPLHLSEEDIFSLGQMVRFYALRARKYYAFYYRDDSFCNNCIIKKIKLA